MVYKPFITNILGLTGSAESGGYIDSYVKGTSTPLTLYADNVGTPAGTSVTADALGQITFYFKDDLEYSWKAYTADGSVNLWAANVVGGALTLTYINPAYAVFPLIEASWALPLATPLHATWPDLFRDGPAALPDIINTTTIVTDLAALRLLSGDEATDGVRVATGRAAGFWRWGNGDQSATVVAATKTVGSVDAGADTLTITAHGLLPGDGVLASAALAGLSLNTLYYVSKVDANTIKLHTSVAAAIDGTSAVNLSALVGSLSLRLLRDPGEVHTVIPTGLALDGSEGCWFKSTDRIRAFTWEAGYAGDGVTDDRVALMHCELLARRTGLEVACFSSDSVISGKVVKDIRTTWRGAHGSRSSGALGTRVYTAFNGTVVEIHGDGVNRRGSIHSWRFEGSDPATYSTATGIDFVGVCRSHELHDVFIANYRDGVTALDGGSGLDMKDVYIFNISRNGVHYTGVTDCVIDENSQLTGDNYGALFEDCGGINVTNSRPQASGVANCRFQGGSLNRFSNNYCDSAIINTATSGGGGVQFVDEFAWICCDNTFYSNGDDQPHIFYDSTAGNTCTDGTITGNIACKSNSNTGTIAGVHAGAQAGTTRRILIDNNQFAVCDVGILFDTVTGAHDTVVIRSGNILPGAAPISGAENVQSKLYIEPCVGMTLLKTLASPTGTVDIDPTEAGEIRVTGSVSSTVYLDLPTTGNHDGKTFKIIRQATGTGAIVVRYGGATSVATLRGSGESVRVCATGTGSTFTLVDAAPSDWRRNQYPGSATVASNVMTIPGFKSAYATASAATVNSFSFPSTAEPYAEALIVNDSAYDLTVTHNTSLIRCPGDVDYVVEPYGTLRIHGRNASNSVVQVEGPAI